MITKIFFISLILVLASSETLRDNVECFRQKDSTWAHFVNCSASKPLPLKAQTTFTVDKNFTWGGVLTYDVMLFDGITKQGTALPKCLQGLPSPGPKTVGMNLTLAITCNSFPRELKQYDMIRYELKFPGLQWLVWSIPIPGYSTYEDIERVMQDEDYSVPIIKSETSQGTSQFARNFLEQVKLLKNIRNNI